MGSNPYIVSEARVKKRVRMVAVASNPLDVFNPRTGEVTRAMPYTGKREWRDISEFVKVYDTDALMGLKSYELKVLFYAWGELEYDGSFWIKREECAEKTGLCLGSVDKGIKGLIDMDMIRRESNGHYWMNPNIAYRGSRDDLLDISRT